MKLVWVVLALSLSAGCGTVGGRRITVDGLGAAVRQPPPAPDYDTDGSLRCSDLRRHGCMITCEHVGTAELERMFIAVR